MMREKTLCLLNICNWLDEDGCNPGYRTMSDEMAVGELSEDADDDGEGEISLPPELKHMKFYHQKLIDMFENPTVQESFPELFIYNTVTV